MSVELNSNCPKLCRICLENKKSHQKLSNHIIIEEGTTKIWICIADLIRDITSDSFQQEENHPDSICNNCEELAIASYLFKIKYQHSSQRLQNAVEDIVKEETEEIVYIISSIDNNDEYTNVCDIKTETKALKRLEDREEKNAGIKLLLHPCPICPMKFSALELKKHCKSHKSLRKYLSIPENKKISSRARFYSENTKIPLISPETDRLHGCLYCDHKLLAHQFKDHLQKHKSEDFRCNQCDRVFKKLNHLNGHRVRAHTEEFLYQCKDCHKGFVVKKNYDCHLLTHTTKELPHVCPHCSKRFSNPNHLNRHLYIHAENISYALKYKVLKCHKCCRNFQSLEEIHSHICKRININTITTGNHKSGHVCKICQKVYSRSGLYNHIKSAHVIDGHKKLCSVCGEKVRDINTHMLKHKGEKPYACTHCDKRFIRKHYLSRHLLVHTELKEFVCSVCAKSFNKLYNLQVHERIHNGERNHICHTCGKTFLEKSYLKKHMNVHKK